MKLYYAPGTCALACWISLEWANAEYSVEKVKLGSEEYKKVNPLGMVPALDINDERAITQVGAILKYISNKYPESNLGSEEGIENEFKFDEIMAFLTGDFHPAFWPFFVPFRYTTSKKTTDLDDVRQASFEKLDKVMNYLDSVIGNTLHIYANKRSVADAYAFVMIKWTEKFDKFGAKTWKEYKNISRFMENMLEDASVKKVLELSK